MIRTLIVLFAALIAVSPQVHSEIERCIEDGDCELVSRPWPPLGAFLALLLSFFGACGHSDPCPVEPQLWTDLGIGVYVEEGAAEWTTYEDLSARIDAMAQIVATYADRPVEGLRGWTIIFRNVYVFRCGEMENAAGCAHPSGWIEIGTHNFRPCLEETVLPHEFLHALGYWSHEDPRWNDWQYVVDSLVALEPTYPTDEGPQSCDVRASRWMIY